MSEPDDVATAIAAIFAQAGIQRETHEDDDSLLPPPREDHGRPDSAGPSVPSLPRSSAH